MSEPRRVALYARVSTATQDPGPQLQRLREWAERQGFIVQFETHDIASGRLVQRRGMDVVMANARGHHIHAVAVAKVDRWARSMQHLATTVNELHGLGVDFYAIDQGLTVKRSDPTSTLILNVLGSVAQWEASIISERTRDGLVGKIGRGRHPKTCGINLPCPTGKHKTNGIAAVKEQTPPQTVGFGNDRLIEPTVQESNVISEPSSEPDDNSPAIVVESEPKAATQ